MMRTHPLPRTIPLKHSMLTPARLSRGLVVLERIQDAVAVEAAEVAVARLPAFLALGAVRGACAGADFLGALGLGGGGGAEGVGQVGG